MIFRQRKTQDFPVFELWFEIKYARVFVGIMRLNIPEGIKYIAVFVKIIYIQKCQLWIMELVFLKVLKSMQMKPGKSFG